MYTTDCYVVLVVRSELFVVTHSFFVQAEDGIRDLVRSRGLGDVYKRQIQFRNYNQICIYFQEKIFGKGQGGLLSRHLKGRILSLIHI